MSQESGGVERRDIEWGTFDSEDKLDDRVSENRVEDLINTACNHSSSAGSSPSKSLQFGKRTVAENRD